MRRVTNLSLRSLRQPQTMSSPASSSSATMRGMSAGSFCRSPSAVTTRRPRAKANPAANAAVWPKLRRNRMTRRCGSRDCSAASCVERVVRAAVVDDDDLVRPPAAHERRRQLVVETLDVGRLVEDRDDDRKLRSHRAGIKPLYIGATCAKVPGSGGPGFHGAAYCVHLNLGPGPRPWPSAHAVGRLAAALGVASRSYCYASLGLTLAHYDAKAHLVVSRRILDSLTPGWEQIGAVWLPLPHLLNMLPGADRLSLSHGRIRHCAVDRFVTRSPRRRSRRPCSLLTSSRAGAALAAALYATNPNVLYLQSTPMTEPLLFGLTTLQVYLVHAVGAGRPTSTVPDALSAWVTVLRVPDALRSVADHGRAASRCRRSRGGGAASRVRDVCRVHATLGAATR